MDTTTTTDRPEIPILFSGPMVRAILDGSKTMTRRALNPQPRAYQAQVIDIKEPTFDDEARQWGQVETEWCWFGGVYQPMREIWRPLQGLRWGTGDRLWVREQFSGEHRCQGKPTAGDRDALIWYWADGNPTRGDWTKPKPSIHLPRWAC